MFPLQLCHSSTSPVCWGLPLASPVGSTPGPSWLHVHLVSSTCGQSILKLFVLSLDLSVAALFVLCCLICLGITLQDGDLLSPRDEPGSDYPLRHRFSLQQALCSLFRQNEATSSLWFSPSSIPEYSTVSPITILNLPQESHLISPTPRTLIPYLCISSRRHP